MRKTSMKKPLQEPPVTARWILKKIVKSGNDDFALGDLYELYTARLQDQSRMKAVCWFWSEILRSFPRFLVTEMFWHLGMAVHIVRTAFRNMKKYKIYSMINCTGLAVSLGCVIFIVLLIRYELSFDLFHTNNNRIFRVFTEDKRPDGSFFKAPVMLPFAPAVKNDLPEVEKVTRIKSSSCLVSRGDQQFYESMYYADKEFLDVLSFPLITGDSRSMLADPFSVVMTEKLVRKYFGIENPIGQVITLNHSENYVLTGILKDVPANSHLRFDMLVSFATLESKNVSALQEWTSFSDDYTYVLLRQGSNPSDIERKLPLLLKKYAGDKAMQKHVLHLQPLKDVHFSMLAYDDAVTISVTYLYVFSAIAFLILMIACINFINLTTARSGVRVKEVAMRKVVGASRVQLIWQFILESLIMSTLSVVVAVIIISCILPFCNNYLHKNILLDLVKDSSLVFILIGIAVVTGLIAAGYPALFLSGFHPARILKRPVMLKKGKGYSFRAVLVMFQFAVSIALMIGTLTVYRQIQYMRRKPLGFDADPVVVIPLRNRLVQTDHEAFKNAILRHGFILSATLSNGTPASGYSRVSNYIPEGGSDRDAVYMLTIEADCDFISTYNLEIISGRNFSKTRAMDRSGTYILNETAAEKLGWNHSIGKRLAMGSEDQKEIIGIVRDFHYFSLQNVILPTVITIGSTQSQFLSIRMDTQSVPEALNFIEATFKKFSPMVPFQYFFIDKQFERYYRSEKTIGGLLLTGTGIGVLISCMGILGLAAFIGEQRRKEIGIRKTLGGSVTSVVTLVFKDLIRIILLANVIGCPVAYWILTTWLRNFAYRIQMGAGVFILSGSVVLIVAMFTAGYHVLKAACMNPVDVLKYE